MPDGPAAFDGLGSIYSRGRSGYAPAAIDAIVDGVRLRSAVDLGCGTGIGTRALVDAGVERLLGVDPNPDMLAAAGVSGDRGGAIVWRRGTALDPPGPEGPVDLVTSFQAYHWFAGAPALRAMRRWLRPGGRLALVWNRRAGGNAFSDAWHDLVARCLAASEAEGHVSPPLRDADPSEGGWFEDVRRVVVPNPHRLDPTTAVERLASSSYCRHAGPAREELLDEARALVAAHADRDGTVELGQETLVILATATATEVTPPNDP